MGKVNEWAENRDIIEKDIEDRKDIKDIITIVEQPEMSPLTAKTIEAGYISMLIDL